MFVLIICTNKWIYFEHLSVFLFKFKRNFVKYSCSENTFKQIYPTDHINKNPVSKTKQKLTIKSNNIYYFI